MKKIFLLSFLLINILFVFPQHQNDISTIDVKHYNFDLQLSDTTDNIIAKATVTVEFLQPISSFQLDLQNKLADGKGMEVAKVIQNNQELFFTHKNNVLNINLPTQPTFDKQMTFEIFYSGIPDDGLIISKNKYNHRTFFSDNWPNRAHHWIPCVDKPADKASVEFIVTAPIHYKIISNGVLIEESILDSTRKVTHWKEDITLPTKVMVIGAADFAVQYCGSVGCIPVFSWVYPENKQAGFYDYAEAVEILQFYISSIGPYPYSKLANVQSKTIFGGMENASAIFYFENSVHGDRSSESLLAHEIAHQWFGDFATETDFSHLWLSEGFATYMTDLYFENKYGNDTLAKMLKQQRELVIEFAKKKLMPVVDTLTTNYMNLLNANSYQKGGWILHMLRRKIGDRLFWKCINKYYEVYGGKNASTIDFEKIVEKVTNNDMHVFFEQWLFESGHPKLNIGWKYNPRKKSITMVIKQMQSSLFEIPLEISLLQVSGPQLNHLEIRQKIETFEIAVKSKPSRIVADPNINLLFEWKLAEIK
jgi:aminopeptidase N